MGETARVGRWVSVGGFTVVLAVVAGMVGSGFVSVGGRPGAWGVVVVDFLLGLVFFFFFFFFAMVVSTLTCQDIFSVRFLGGGRSQMSPKSQLKRNE